MIRKALLVLVVLLTVLGGRVFYLVTIASGQFTEFETVLVDQCQKLEVAPGPEDIAIDHETGFAYIATAERRNWSSRPRGGLYVIDLNDPNASPRKVLGDTPADFSPHGLSFWRSGDGTRRLFVVNHPKDNETIEVFDVSETGELTHLETISFDAMYSPNDVVAVGPRQFYVSNDQKFKEGFGEAAELYLALPFSDIAYFDETDGRKVAGGFAYANGVNVSPDGKTIYAAEVIGRRINAFDRDPVSGALSNRRRFKVGTAPDNIDIGPDGSLYIGAHPNLLAFSKHAGDPSAVSPSQVVKLDPETGDAETVFMSLNGEINGSATGPYWNGHLLVGGVFDSHIMWCQPEA